MSQHKSPTSMHGFSPRRRNFGRIFRHLDSSRDAHGEFPRAIGGPRTQASATRRNRNNRKVRHAEQSPAEINESSLSYSKRRELITHGTNWKLMLSRLLTTTQQNNHVCRSSRPNPAKRTQLSSRRLPVAPADFNDGEVGWGKFRTANSSHSTVLNESSSSASFNSSADAAKIRRLMKQQRNAQRNRDTYFPVEERSATARIAQQNLAEDPNDSRLSFLPNSEVPKDTDSRSIPAVLGLRLRPEVIPSMPKDMSISRKKYSAENATRSAGRAAIVAGDQDDTSTANILITTTTTTPGRNLPQKQELRPEYNEPTNTQRNLDADNPKSATSAVTSRISIPANSPASSNASASVDPKTNAVDAKLPHNHETIDNSGPAYEDGSVVVVGV